MRLLIVTQAVDETDPVLGFFCRWIEALSERFDVVEVVCLREGEHRLPPNVRVHSLGKESGRSRLKYVIRILRYIVGLEYDCVLVHMNEEYVLLAAWWWRLSGKRAVLWRNHKEGSWRTRAAVLCANAVCYTSPEAFVAYSHKAVRMPVGIDTNLFTPAEQVHPGVLFLGRLDPIKKADVFVEALRLLDPPIRADVYGSPTDPHSPYAKSVAEKITVYPPVPHAQTPALYRSHGIYVNLTPSGSFDKTIGEAMACGCVVVCANAAVREVIPDQLFVHAITPAEVARALRAALALGEEERARISCTNREYVVREHSLSLLVECVAALLRV